MFFIKFIFQIAAGSVTCLALMGVATDVDKISGKLKLL